MDMQGRKATIQQAFDTVAMGYDHPSLAFFPETAKRLLEHLDLNDDAHMLDVCTGTGAVALGAAEKMTQGKVTGIDLSSGMLQQAQLKADQRQLDNVEFIQMDLEQMTFPEQYFDVATSSFGVFFLENMAQALSAIVKRVKPGGRIAISSFFGNAFSPMSDLFTERYQAFGREVPPLSWKRLSTEEDMTALFRNVGINAISIHHEPLGCYMESAQDWWNIVWNAGYRGFLNQLSEQEQIDFKQQHMHEIAALCEDARPWLDTGVLIVVVDVPKP